MSFTLHGFHSLHHSVGDASAIRCFTVCAQSFLIGQRTTNQKCVQQRRAALVNSHDLVIPPGGRSFCTRPSRSQHRSLSSFSSSSAAPLPSSRCPPTRHRRCSSSSTPSRSLSTSVRCSRPLWRTVFFGTDDYAVVHLKALHESHVSNSPVPLIQSLEVVTPSSKCAVRSYAESCGLTVHSWPPPSSLVNRGRFDVGVVVSFGHLIPKSIIDVFPFGILNVHPSILPRWRGASPIIHTVLNGDTDTGISIMGIRPVHFDVGPLLMQVKYPVPENCTTLQLRDYLAVEGASLLKCALRDLECLERMEYEQKEYGITYAHKLTGVNARVNWIEQTPRDIDRQYRALSELFGLRSQWRNQPIRLLDMVSTVEMDADDIKTALVEDHPDLSSVRPGQAHYLSSRDIICIRCKNGWVGFRAISIKKRMSARCFYNGYLSKTEYRGVLFESQDNGLERHATGAHDTLHPVRLGRRRGSSGQRA